MQATIKELASKPGTDILKSLGKVLDVGGPVLAAIEASNDQTNGTAVGRGANVVAQTLVDVLVGKSNPIVAILDGVASAAVGLTPAGGPNSDYSLGKNLGGGVQSIIALLETLGPGDKAQLLEAIRQKNEKGENGAFVRFFAQTGNEWSTSINDVLDKFRKSPDVIAAQWKQEQNRRIAIRRQQGG